MKRDERGIALVITLFLMAALSALAVSMMFLSQTETASSRNYRTMSQARYGGEAGVHMAINYLNSTAYTGTAITYANYDMTKSPVQCIGGGCSRTSPACDPTSTSTIFSTNCVVLTANYYVNGVLKTSNYDSSTIRTAFASAITTHMPLAVNGSGTTTNGAMGTVSFGVYAVLMSMRTATIYGGGTGQVQTWQIVADGSAGPASAQGTVEVMGTFEKSIVPASTYAVFATNNGCGAITYVGNGGTDSYNSTSMTLSGGHPVTVASGGSIGTNGNLNIGGSVAVDGSLSTPRTGVGACTSGSITAETTSGTATVTGGIIQLSQAKTYPNPTIPAPGTLDLDFTGKSLSDCATMMLDFNWTCTAGSGTYSGFYVIAPGALGTNTLSVNNLTLGSNNKVVIAGSGAVTVNANSFTAVGTSALAITNSATTMNLTGSGVDPVMDMQGNFSTTAFDPTKLQIMYAGTGTIKLRGNNELAATIYAPNSYVDMSSSYDVYGSILAGRYNNSGGAMVHYDTSLSSRYFTLSNPYMSSFTWRKY